MLPYILKVIEEVPVFLSNSFLRDSSNYLFSIVVLHNFYSLLRAADFSCA